MDGRTVIIESVHRTSGLLGTDATDDPHDRHEAVVSILRPLENASTRKHQMEPTRMNSHFPALFEERWAVICERTVSPCVSPSLPRLIQSGGKLLTTFVLDDGGGRNLLVQGDHFGQYPSASSYRWAMFTYSDPGQLPSQRPLEPHVVSTGGEHTRARTHPPELNRITCAVCTAVRNASSALTMAQACRAHATEAGIRDNKQTGDVYMQVPPIAGCPSRLPMTCHRGFANGNRH